MVNRPNRKKPTKRSGFSNYKPPSFDQVKKIATQKGGRFDSIFKNNFDSWRAKDGSNQVRVCPPTWEGYEHYAYEVFVHKNVGADNSTYLCLNKNRSTKTGQPLGKPCPICNAAKKMKEDGDADGAKEIQVTQQYVAWICDRDAKNLMPPALWAMSWTQNRDLAALCINERTGKTLPIAHAEEGYDVMIKRMGTGLQTKYVLSIDREESAITDDADEMAELEEFLTENPVPATLKYYDFDYLENVVSGTAEEGDEDLDEDEDDKKSKKTKRSLRDEEDEDEEEAPKRRKKVKDEEEDEESDEEDSEEESEEEDEDEEKPRRKHRAKSEDDEDEESEEEEEEQPRSSKRARRPAKDEDEEDEESDDDSEEDEEEEPPKKTARRTLKKSSGQDEEEEERPRRRRR